MSATVMKLRTGDKDAVAIGHLCEKAKGSMVDSVKYLIEAGQKLTKKKSELGHGEWLPWLKDNTDALGFNNKRTAQRLMNVANKSDAGVAFTEAEASQISKSVWGHTKRSSKPRRIGKKPDENKIQVALHTTPENWERFKSVAKSEDKAVATKLNEVIAESIADPVIDPATLAPSAQEKLEIAKRQIERQLKAEQDARMRELDEEVRQRVVAEGKEYVSRMNALEEKAWNDEKHWREMVNNHKPLFTVEQFKVILMCLHPDGVRTAEKLSQAFRLFNNKKLQLTGEK